MDGSVKKIEGLLEKKWDEHMGHVKGLDGVKDVEEFLAMEKMRVASGVS